MAPKKFTCVPKRLWRWWWWWCSWATSSAKWQIGKSWPIDWLQLEPSKGKCTQPGGDNDDHDRHDDNDHGGNDDHDHNIFLFFLDFLLIYFRISSWFFLDLLLKAKPNTLIPVVTMMTKITMIMAIIIMIMTNQILLNHPEFCLAKILFLAITLQPECVGGDCFSHYIQLGKNMGKKKLKVKIPDSQWYWSPHTELQKFTFTRKHWK